MLPALVIASLAPADPSIVNIALTQLQENDTQSNPVMQFSRAVLHLLLQSSLALVGCHSASRDGEGNGMMALIGCYSKRSF